MEKILFEKEMDNNRAHSGFCSHISSIYRIDTYYDMLAEFPEIDIFEPKNHDMWWFPKGFEGQDQRKDVLKKAIRLTVYKLMIERIKEINGFLGEDYWRGLCGILTDVYGSHRAISTVGAISSFINDYEELWAQKPKTYYVNNRSYWWVQSNSKRRIKALNDAIKLVTSKT